MCDADNRARHIDLAQKADPKYCPGVIADGGALGEQY